MAAIGRLVGVDPIEKKIWSLTAKAHHLMMPRLLGCNAHKVATRAILHVKGDTAIDRAPKTLAEVKDGLLLCVSAVNNLPIEVPGWNFRGFTSEDEGTSGRSFLFGLTPDQQVVDCPVSLEWVDRFIAYYDGGTEE